METGLKIEKTKEQNREHLREGAVLLFLIVVFTAIFLAGGVKTYPDTESYLKLSPIREPGYALLLKGMYTLFGENGFAVMGVFQNALAVCSVYLTARYIGSKFKGNYILYAAVLCMLLPYVITPLFASSGLILTNAMISEGVTLSLYNFYFLFLLKAVWEKQDKHLWISLILSFLLWLIRGQMAVTLLAWGITAVVLFAEEKAYKKIGAVLLLLVLTAAARQVCVNGCNLLANGVYTKTAYGNVTILSNVIYVAEKEDGEAIRDDTLRHLFYEIYDIAENGRMLYKNAPEDFSAEAVFYSDMHDDIKDFAIFPILQDYVEQEEGITNYTEKLIRVDSLCSGMTRELLTECGGKWLAHYVRNAAVGMIRTAAYVHPLFNIPAFIGYGILILAGIVLWRKNKESRAVKMLLLTALLTAGNIAAVAITIMCLSRYMIYNMAFVYITAVLLFAEIAGVRRANNK